MFINRVGKMLYKGGGFGLPHDARTHVMSRTTLAIAKGVFYASQESATCLCE